MKGATKISDTRRQTDKQNTHTVRRLVKSGGQVSSGFSKNNGWMTDEKKKTCRAENEIIVTFLRNGGTCGK